MKKLVVLIAFAVAIISCKTAQPTVNTTLAKKSEVKMKGDWTISSVTYPGSDYIKVTSFDIADSKCFVGSTWKFISNNNSGNMALTNASCTAFDSKLTWYVNKENQFVMKFLNEGLKAKKVKEGYILKVAEQTENSFQLLDGINVGGKMVNVVYQFTKS